MDLLCFSGLSALPKPVTVGAATHVLLVSYKPLACSAARPRGIGYAAKSNYDSFESAPATARCCHAFFEPWLL